ncbi:elongation factor G-like protein EF-G2 [Nocardiopsis alba]|uniref:elongation factor G-like protein EF-G2 n=1 Tax=Nocardiopsis alba TaxID=53437 RepID=UPI0035E1CB53
MVDRTVAAPRAEEPRDIRNVALVGPSGSGKTSLVEALLVESGVIRRPGSVEEGTTVSDHDGIEIRRHRSARLTLAPVMAGGVKVNLLDTPGHPDFLGATRAGLRGADAALFVISAMDGVDGRTRTLWRECAALGMPRAVAVTGIDHPRADFDSVVARCREAFGPGVHAAYVPAFEGSGDRRSLVGLWGLISERYYDYSDGEAVPRPVPARLREASGPLREIIVEEVITESEDERLMERYMEGGVLDPDLLIADVQRAVAAGGFHPVLALDTVRGVGVRELLRELPLSCPDPTLRPLPRVERPDGRGVEGMSCDPEGPLVAEVLSTENDPYVGRMSLVRIFSGTLAPEVDVHLSGAAPDEEGRAGERERSGSLFVPAGPRALPVGEVVAGDLCLVSKLMSARTGDTLSSPERPLRVRPWAFPDPMMPVAIAAASSADEDRLSRAVARLVSEDPSLRVEVDPETRQMVMWSLGEAHLEAALDRLESHHGVRVDTEEPRVPLRETFTVPGQGVGRNVKQSGGHGEYGVCRIRVEPLESGAGLEFVDRIVGGVVPRRYVPAVEKGVRAQMADGIGDGFPLVDLRVTLYDGKAHSVDSSDMAFQKAGRLAIRDAATTCEPALLEPLDTVTVEVEGSDLGAVLNDLSARRGRVVGTETVDDGRVVVRAEVPELEIVRYAVELRALSHGTGTFTRSYLRHERLPGHLEHRVARPRSGDRDG